MKPNLITRCAAVAAVACLALTACGSSSKSGAGSTSGGKHGTIGVSFDLLNAIRTSEKVSIEKAAAAAGYKVVFSVADQDAQKQASQIQDLIQTRKVDALIVIAQDGKQIASSISLAKARRVPFVTIDRAVADEQDITFQITGDPKADGKLAADEFAAAAKSKPLKVLELVGALTDQNAIGRRDGFDHTLDGNPDVTVVSRVPTNWDPSQALDGTSNALQKDSGINAIFVPSDFLLPSVQSALTTAKRLAPVGDPKHVFLVTIDGDENGCKAIKDKTLDADIATRVDQFGKEAVASIATALAKQTVNPKTVQSAGVTLDQANFAAVSSQVWGCGA
ncbi:sugar ABC transporter substrate-binding protein [Streptomyces sp. NPDC008079]|uniref:sugar ABC transporter substrate-binding protein n=1 Tax=Streptomyces sp. NPDC008079 TaxID=3364806 RepID=UPI0036E49944